MKTVVIPFSRSICRSTLSIQEQFSLVGNSSNAILWLNTVFLVAEFTILTKLFLNEKFQSLILFKIICFDTEHPKLVKGLMASLGLYTCFNYTQICMFNNENIMVIPYEINKYIAEEYS